MAVSAELVAELNRIGAKAEKRVAVNATEFNAMVTDYATNLVPKQVVTYMKWLAMQMLRRVVMKTPVDSGRARGNWQVTVGSPAGGEVEVNLRTVRKRHRVSAPKRAVEDGETLAKGKAGMAGVRPYGVVWITNNVPYILQLEGGWSGQAPVGMLAVSMEEMHGKDVPR